MIAFEGGGGGDDNGFDLAQKHEHWEDKKSYTALEIAQLRGHEGVVALLSRLHADADGTRQELRLELGLVDNDYEPSKIAAGDEKNDDDGPAVAAASNNNTASGDTTMPKRRRVR